MTTIEQTAVPDVTWHRGDWMQTYTGKKFYPMAPHPEDVDILDIAHSLSMQCRYNGHVRVFYSVAEHCIHMSRAVAPGYALWALLHDATEAYVGDMVRPLKLQLPSFKEAEDRVEIAIAEHFGVTLTDEMHRAVKAVDTRILINERHALLGPSPQSWSSLDGLEPLNITIRAWSPPAAEARYYDRFLELTGALND